jgi:hypothetical protein
MSDQKLTVTIEANSREDLIYWLNHLAKKLQEWPNGTSGRSSGGGYVDWAITEVRS